MQKRPPTHWVYVVCCADGTLYTGYARDPEKRTAAHNTGHGAKYTAGRRPVTLVYTESFSSRGKALTREWEIKRWSRADKVQLIASARPPRQTTAPHRVEATNGSGTPRQILQMTREPLLD